MLLLLFLLICFSVVSVGTADPQTEALDAFARLCYNSSSFVFQNWLVVKPTLCRRFGVSCVGHRSSNFQFTSAMDDATSESGRILVRLSLPGTGCFCPMENAATSLRALANLTHLDLSRNHLHGSIPGDMFVTAWPGLISLTLQDNKLSGPLPSHLDRLPVRLRHLDLSQNFLSSRIPDWLADPSLALSDLLLNSNLLFGPVPGGGPNGGQLGGSNGTAPLARLDLSANRLSGPISFASQLTNLIQLSLAVNQFSGELISVQPLPQLVVLDVSRNRLSGPISPYLFEHPKLAVIFLSNNQDLFFDTVTDGAANSSIPPALYFDESSVLSFPTFSCPQLRPRHRYQVIDVPPQISNYTHCTCNQGFHLVSSRVGSGGSSDSTSFQCQQCPPNSLCPPGVNRVSPARGYYLEESEASNTVVFIPCPPISHNVTSCNPTNRVFDSNSPHSLQCAPGYQGRLCFECDDSFFKFGSVCEKCSPVTEFVAPLVLGFLLLFVFVYLWRVENLSLASTKIYIFYLQTVSLLADLNIPLPQAMLSFSRLAAVANLSVPGFECMFQNTTLSRSMIRMIAVVSSPLIVGLIIVVVSACIYIVEVFRLRRRIKRQLLRDRSVTPDASKDDLATRARSHRQLAIRKRIAGRAIRVFVWFLWIAQLKISTNFFRLLACEPDAAQPDRSYLRFQPDLECSFSGPWGAQLVMGSFAGLAISILLPLAVAIVLVVNRNDLQAVAPQLGQLFQMYRPKYFWWEFVLLFRKLSLALVVALFGYQSLFLPLMIVIILAISLTLQRSFKPFATRLENGLECLPSADAQVLGIGLTVVNIFVFLSLSVTLVAQHSRRAWKYWRAKQKSLFEDSSHRHDGGYHSLPFDLLSSTGGSSLVSSDNDSDGDEDANHNVDDFIDEYESIRNFNSPRKLTDVTDLK